MVQHASLGETKRIFLEQTNAASTNSATWNDTAPTSSVFSVGTNGDTNGNTSAIIAYLFAPKQGFSKFGSYVGNGNANGTFVYTGFRPAMVIIKTSSYASQNWNLYDTKRDTGNITEGELNPNDNSSEDTSGNKIDILSNGFKCRVSYDATNRSGETYIYMAWAEAPFVNSEGVPCNAR
jgi:phage terminase large subunit-like protein